MAHNPLSTEPTLTRAEGPQATISPGIAFERAAQTAEVELSPWRTGLVRMFVAILLGFALTAIIGWTAWSKTPYSDAEMRAAETPDEAKVRVIRDQEVNELRIALGRRLPTNRRADLYYRLAEIYLEAYHQSFLLEGRVHEKRLSKGIEDTVIDRTHSVPYLSAGINACRTIIGLGIPYPKLDAIYYFLAFNYGELGNRKESLRYYDYLVRTYPSSAFASEGYRELGEQAFTDQDFKKAEQQYQLALNHAPGDQAARILHKLAWSYYRTKQYDRAIETMKRVVSEAQKQGEKFVSLKEEALRDMAVFMTESGRVDEAIAYFKEVAGDKDFYAKTLERLGAQYERNAQASKASQVYDSLLKTGPDAETAFRVTVKLVDLDVRRGKYDDALKRVGAVQFPTGGVPATQAAYANLKAMVRRTATDKHALYRKTKDPAALRVADSYYTVYLSRFLTQPQGAEDNPSHKNDAAEGVEIEMYLAEVKRDEGDSAAASQLYQKVVESRDKRYATEAGALWTASLAEAVSKQPPHAGGDAPSDMERQFVAAADAMAASIGDTNEGREAQLRSARLLAGYKSTRPDAIARIRKLIATSPKSPQALTGARLWLQLQADQLPSSFSGDLTDSQKAAIDGTNAAMREISANSALMAADQGKLKAMIDDLNTRMRVGQIAHEESTQDFGGAAKGYEAFAADTKDRDIAEKAYANAVSAYLKAGDGESVDRVTAAWLHRFPKSGKGANTKVTEQIRSASTQFLIQGNFDVAARLFEHLGKGASDADSLETAARVYDGLGDSAHAQADWSEHLSMYPSSPNHAKVMLALARSYDQSKLDSEAARMYKACLAAASEVQAECGVRLADLYLKNQDIEGAKKVLKRIAAGEMNRSSASITRVAERSSASTKKKTKKTKTQESASSPFVAYARFRLAEMIEQEGHFEPLSLPEKKLVAGINQRVEFLEPLARAYDDAVRAGGPWAIASLDHLAAWAFHFADEIDGIAPTPGADAAAVAQFRQALKKQSDVPRKRALSSWKEAYNRAVQSEILSPDLPVVVDRLADAGASPPARAQGPHGRFRLAGMPSDGGADGHGAAIKKTRDRLMKSSTDAAAWVDYGNLLWGEGRPGIAKIAYDRALSLNRKNPAALSNRGAMILGGDGEDDWLTAAEAQALFHEAVRQDDFFLPAKFNEAMLFNYYRLFAKAKALWVQVLVRSSSADAVEGQAIAELGLGDVTKGTADLKRATDLGLPSSRFTALYHAAAREKDGSSCVATAAKIDDASLVGFERSAVERLRTRCIAWQKTAH